MTNHPGAGQPAPRDMWINLARLMADYYSLEPASPVAFGTSGHRGRASEGSFNEGHVAAIVQAVCEFRTLRNYRGPLFLAYDTHALSEAAYRTALEVLAANDIPTIIHSRHQYTPTPVTSFLILRHNQARPEALADGLIITPSHNPPTDGGLKYNPPHGGPADQDITTQIERRANELLKQPGGPIKRIPFERALKSPLVTQADFIRPFADALGEVVNLEAVKNSGLKLAADPMGGSGTCFWEPIAERWGLNLTVVNPLIDPGFTFMPLDGDGQIRMDCSSPLAMANLLAASPEYDLAFGNDPDFDRHGIVSDGLLMNPNHYLAVVINYLPAHRPKWRADLKIGKTLVSSSLIDRVTAAQGRELYETPVGFKWFVDGLRNGRLAFGGEESAGAAFLTFDGRPWTTDKDGFSLALLAAEIMAVTGRSPQEHYQRLAEEHGAGYYGRVDSPLNPAAKTALAKLNVEKLVGAAIAGLKVKAAFTKAPGNGAELGGVKLILEDGSWLALRPSGTEPKMKLYIESFQGAELWQKLAEEGPALVVN